MDVKHSYVARCPKCGRVVGATIDDPDHQRETSRFVAELIRDGFPVERMTISATREAMAPGLGCRCPEKLAEQNQGKLFAAT